MVGLSLSSDGFWLQLTDTGKVAGLRLAPGKEAGMEIQMSLYLQLSKCQTLGGTLNATDKTVRDSPGGRRDEGSGTSVPLRLRSWIKNKNTLETLVTLPAQGECQCGLAVCESVEL